MDEQRRRHEDVQHDEFGSEERRDHEDGSAPGNRLPMEPCAVRL
jgi:hypothetical protein